MWNYIIVPHTSPPPIFLIHTKYCRENEICDFKKHKATKKEVSKKMDKSKKSTFTKWI